MAVLSNQDYMAKKRVRRFILFIGDVNKGTQETEIYRILLLLTIHYIAQPSSLIASSTYPPNIMITVTKMPIISRYRIKIA